MAKSRIASLLLVSFVLAMPTGAEPLDPESAQVLRQGVVRTIVDGTNAAGRVCNPRGTGFFIDRKGHILTAAHNVEPCEGVPWKDPPDVNVELINLADGASTTSVTASIIYVDAQTDLALLRADVNRSIPLPLAPAGTFRDNTRVSMFSFDMSLATPAVEDLRIESVFNPGRFHAGLIDVSGPGVKPSASGGPVFDEEHAVAGVLTKGGGAGGEAAVPISYASPLFHMVGVSYPSAEVREVIEELRKDIVHWSAPRYDPTTGDVTIEYTKRLESGTSPAGFVAIFRVYSSKGRFQGSEFAVEFSLSVPVGQVVGKRGQVVFEKVGSQADDFLRSASATRADGAYGPKSYAEVTVRATFGGGVAVPTSIQRKRMDF